VRILFLCEGDAETSDSWSGVSQSVVRHLREAGHTVIPGDVDLYGLRRLVVGLETWAWNRKRWWVRYHLDDRAFRARSSRAARVVREADGPFDLIFQIGATFQVPRIPGIPLVMYCDSNIELARAGAASGHSEASALTAGEIEAIRRQEAGVYAAADLIFTMSDLVRRSFIDDFDVPPEKLVTIHCAPNFDPEQVSAREPGDGQGAPTVLFVGRDFERKGGDLLVEALERVRTSVPEARLRIVGARPRGEWPEWIEFTGYLDRDTAEGRAAMDRAYRTASVFCLPTRFEPFGTSFVEAMSYGLPCVGPDAWAVPEIIVDGETGLIVPPEDAASLAEALIKVLTDSDRSARMGQAGRARVLENFTWPRLIERVLAAMKSLVANGGTGDGPTPRGGPGV
jgi:glycosyltransferase involved in cell wall biosynthesis